MFTKRFLSSTILFLNVIAIGFCQSCVSGYPEDGIIVPSYDKWQVKEFTKIGLKIDSIIPQNVNQVHI